MPHIDSFYPSDYLKGADLGNETYRVTIKRIQVESIGSDERGEEKERKPVLYFNELDRGLVLNRTNADTLSSAYGPDTDGWTGRPIDLYFDPNVTFGHKRVGGIRLTVPRQETYPIVTPNINSPIPLGGQHPYPQNTLANYQQGQHYAPPRSPSRTLVDRVAGEDRDRDAPLRREEDYGRAGPR